MPGMRESIGRTYACRIEDFRREWERLERGPSGEPLPEVEVASPEEVRAMYEETIRRLTEERDEARRFLPARQARIRELESIAVERGQFLAVAEKDRDRAVLSADEWHRDAEIRAKNVIDLSGALRLAREDHANALKDLQNCTRNLQGMQDDRDRWKTRAYAAEEQLCLTKDHPEARRISELEKDRDAFRTRAESFEAACAQAVRERGEARREHETLCEKWKADGGALLDAIRAGPDETAKALLNREGPSRAAADLIPRLFKALRGTIVRERRLLEVGRTVPPTEEAGVPDAMLAQIQRQLAEAVRQRDEELERAQSLEAERNTLRRRLESIAGLAGGVRG